MRNSNSSVMTHKFSQVPRAEIQRSSFDRSNGFKTTFDSGYLVPIFVDEVLPGDTHSVNPSVIARLNTPLVPIMDNMFCDTFFFFVPNRLVWDNWQKFCGEQTNPGDSTDYVVPQQVSPTMGGYVNESLQDYMGLPTQITQMTHSALPLRCYNLIYNTWFRDQNLQNSVVVDTGDGPDTVTDYVLLRRGRRHDYFTSCLPWPQKGSAVTLPLGSTAPVITSGVQPNIDFPAHTNQVIGVNSTGQIDSFSTPGTNYPFTWGSVTGMQTDLSSATAATINSIRQAFQIQRLLERDARGGTRYTEVILAHFGVTSPDARLQRPELLSTSSTPINITAIPQTSASNGTDTPQGNLAAIGTMSSSKGGFTYSATEHGWILGMMSVRADQTYQQGLNRMWSRNTRYDFYWPALAHLGEQAVLYQEIYCQGGGSPYDTQVFGYQERYAEYRYKPSIVTGQYRSNYSTPLDYWHLAMDYGSLPALNSTFIVEQPPVPRIIAVDSGPEFKADIYFRQTSARPMPTYSVPGLVDHF